MQKEKQEVRIFIGHYGTPVSNFSDLIEEHLIALGIECDTVVTAPRQLELVRFSYDEPGLSQPPAFIELTEHMVSRPMSFSDPRLQSDLKIGEVVRPPVNTTCNQLFSQIRVSVCGSGNTGKTTLIHYIEHLLKTSCTVEVAECRRLLLDHDHPPVDPQMLEEFLSQLGERVKVSIISYPLRRSQPLSDLPGMKNEQPT